LPIEGAVFSRKADQKKIWPPGPIPGGGAGRRPIPAGAGSAGGKVSYLDGETTNTLSPTTIGEVPLQAGSFTFQETLESTVHSTGKFSAEPIPFQLGPRHAGQSAKAKLPRDTNKLKATKILG